ncbi:MAG: phosphatase PAP2 family protein [Promethearchaeota archaeon]|jgi:undecaprenyl-diphosphatase
MDLKDFPNRIDRWDQRLIIKYNGFGGKPVTIFLKAVSFFGRETIWIFLIAFFLLIWYDPFLLTNLSAVFLMGLLFIAVTKRVFNRPRPFERLGEGKIQILERKPKSRSFPSWHSYNIIAYGLLLGCFFTKSSMVTFLLLFLAVLVSISRIQLGVHYPTDVIIGSLIGILGFLVSIYYIAPLLQMIVIYFEQFALYEIDYQRINSMLNEHIWYLIITVLIFLIIFLSATYKIIKDHFKKRES